MGEMLVRRRVELDPRYRNRRAFARERDPRLYRLFSDIELGKRPGYKPSALAAVEAAYQLQPGSIGRFLDGGSVEPGDSSRGEPATAAAAAAAGEVPGIIGVLATIGHNTPEEVAEMTALTDKVQAVVAAARGYQPAGRLDGHRLFPRDSAEDQKLARAWGVLNPMGLDDELQASIAVWNVVSRDGTPRERRAEGRRAGGESPPARCGSDACLVSLPRGVS